MQENIFPLDSTRGWTFTAEYLESHKGELLTLDIDFGLNCSLNCPHCFRQNNRVNVGAENQMTYSDLVKLVLQAQGLGLKSIKFLGAGEPFEDVKFIKFLRFLHFHDIIPCIFTKGHVIGDDNAVKKWNSCYGISTGEALVEELRRLNASILLGFNSFDEKIQNKMVGNIADYTQKRNRALELLMDAGFNDGSPSRLCIIPAPLTLENYDEMFGIYKWARTNNIHTAICPTMVSGRCSKEKTWQRITPSDDKLIDLYSNIYKFNIEHKIQTLDQIKQEGISPYAGEAPCNQVACGMYVTLTGKVLRCPGDDTTVFGDLFSDSLENIWENSENYRRAGTFNCGCPPKDGKSIPSGFFDKVMRDLENKLKKKRNKKIIIWILLLFSLSILNGGILTAIQHFTGNTLGITSKILILSIMSTIYSFTFLKKILPKNQ